MTNCGNFVLFAIVTFWAAIQPAMAEVIIKREGDYAVRITSEERIEVEAQLYPAEFEVVLPCLGDDTRAMPIQFVLIEPSGDVTIEGLTLDAPNEPFYIARDVLSIGQVLRLDIDCSRPLSELHQEFVRGEMEAWGQAARDQGAYAAFKDYLNDIHNPYLFPTAYSVNNLLHSATLRLGGIVRVPTFSEWLLAMRGKRQGKRFWWGDKWPPPEGQMSDNWDEDGSAAKAWRRVQRIHTGPVNPFGLHHMIGNVSQLIFPTMNERQAISRHYQPGMPGWIAKQEELAKYDASFNREYWRERFVIGPYQFCKAGGSAFSRVGQGEMMAASLAFIAFTRFPGIFQNHPLITDAVGIRLVIPAESAVAMGLAERIKGDVAP